MSETEHASVCFTHSLTVDSFSHYNGFSLLLKWCTHPV